MHDNLYTVLDRKYILLFHCVFTWGKISRPKPAESTTITVSSVCSNNATNVFTPNTKAYRFILRLAAIWYLQQQK